MRYGWLAPVLVSLLLTSIQAQLRGGAVGNNYGNVHVRVLLGNDRNAGPYLKVELMEGSTDTVVATGYTNDIGETEFLGITIGDYHVVVSGDGIETTSGDTFEVDNRKVTQSQYISVRRLEDSGPKPVSAHSAVVSAADLNVPVKARKELDKANESMAQHDWKKAKEHLDKALGIDPNYATAYNNLAVLYAKTDDATNEEQALKKAISLDPHFAPALLNYAKLSIRQKNFPQAQDLLQKEVAVDPDNPEALLLLAHSDYMNHQFEAAIANADKAHAASKDHASFVHYIAARAYQQENRPQDALAEFNLFLKEEPKGPRADFVRKVIATMHAGTPSAPPPQAAKAQQRPD
jgi:predicted Zn-dependent protease